MDQTGFIKERRADAHTMTVGDAAEPRELRKGTVITYLVVAAILALSSFLPWERFLFTQASGLEVGRGWIVLLCGALAAGMAGVSLAKGYALPGLRHVQFLAAAAGTGMFAAEYAALSEACEEMQAGLFSAGDSTSSCVGTFMGIGAVVALLAGAALGLFALIRRPTE